MSKISYAITVCNEFEEIQKLLSFLRQNIDHSEDEIVILVDKPKASEELCKYLWKEAESPLGNINIHWSEFKGDFAEWKKKLNFHCKGDYIFQIDADEIPSKALIRDLHKILEDNPEVDLFWIPRRNLVNGITPEDIQKWHWKDTEKGINWPDYQGRIYRHSSKIHWEGKVHEKIVGFKKYAAFPDIQTTYRLDHFKDIEKQRAQNALYDEIQK